MKVLQICGTFVGSQKQIETAIHKCLLKNGDDSNILYVVGDISDDKNIVKCEYFLGNLFRRFFYKYLRKNKHSGFFNTIKAIRFIKKTCPNVVHLHVMHHGYFDFELLLKFLAKKRIPVVYTMHDFWAMTGGCYHFVENDCNKYNQLCKNCDASYENLDTCSKNAYRNICKKYRFYNNLSDICFVSVSQWVYNIINQSKLNIFKQELIRNAIDVNEINYIEKEPKNDKFTIIGVANCWTEKKGISMFFQLAKMLGDRYLIILVGNISDRYLKTVPSNVKLIGKCKNREELFRLYYESDLHVSLSTMETFGLTFVEAACVGTKSLGFDSTAISCVLQEIDGIVVEPNNIASIKENIEHFYNNKDDLIMKKNRVLEIRNNFSSEKMVEKYRELYYKISKD